MGFKSWVGRLMHGVGLSGRTSLRPNGKAATRKEGQKVRVGQVELEGRMQLMLLDAAAVRNKNRIGGIPVLEYEPAYERWIPGRYGHKLATVRTTIRLFAKSDTDTMWQEIKTVPVPGPAYVSCMNTTEGYQLISDLIRDLGHAQTLEVIKEETL